MNGKQLNILLNLEARHALYREDGCWYHHLTDFPGVLLDFGVIRLNRSSFKVLKHKIEDEYISYHNNLININPDNSI